MSEGTAVGVAKKISMAPFVSYPRRSHFYALLAARLELVKAQGVVSGGKPDALVQAVDEVGSALADAWREADSKEALVLPDMKDDGVFSFNLVDFFNSVFGSLTASERVMLKAISAQQETSMSVKGLRSLSALVLGEAA